MEINGTHKMLLQMLIIVTCFAILNYAVQSDINCLISLKESIEDSNKVLPNWDFSKNYTEGFFCRFTGVECWQPDESKVLSIRLSDMGLRGPFPIGLKNCTSLTGLNLSSNNFTGRIPSNVADVLPFITTLDLSNNSLSGPVPPNIANLSFITVLKLDNNQFTGQIPTELSQLCHLKEFSVANNRLSGQVPIFCNSSFHAESYAHNLGLCGRPLSRCKINETRDHHFFSGFAVGLPVSNIITTLLMFYMPRVSIRKIRWYPLRFKEIPLNSQIQFMEEQNTEERKITYMEKYIRRMSLDELKLATNDFDIKNVIGYGDMGLMYKSLFPNGLMLAVKRLHNFLSFEKEFLLETEILGRLRHINLVPLLSFCFEMEKKFLVYKYMSNGTLHQWLHSRPQVEGMKMRWSLRLRIAVRIARGLAWLHHNNVLRVAHLKISSKCILLDDNFEPKISNFGNSKILMNTSHTLSSGCNFQVPHYCLGPYKKDVHSFGILLLELLSGREWLSAEINSLRYIVFDEEFSMIDECLMGQGFDEEIYETLKIAENCIQTHQDGATSMLEVYQAIRVIGISKNEIYDDSRLDIVGNEDM